MNNFIICGPIASGKDTLTSFLPGLRVAFADELKIICKLIRIDIISAYNYAKDLFGDKKPCNLMAKICEFEEYPIETKDRKLIRDFGMWARKKYPNIWIDAVKRKIKPMNQYVITDTRFLNELESFPNFISIYIDTSLDIRKERALKRDGKIFEEQFIHPTELSIPQLKDKCKYVIDNNGTIDNLKGQVKEILKEVNE